jgi:hypothetical protein
MVLRQRQPINKARASTSDDFSMRLSFQDVDYFLTVLRSTSRLEAAKSLGVTEPALGRAIQRVEAEFGLVLFTRHARGVRMTREGEKFVAVLQSMSAGYSHAVRVVAQLRSGDEAVAQALSTDCPYTSETQILSGAGLRHASVCAISSSQNAVVNGERSAPERVRQRTVRSM